MSQFYIKSKHFTTKHVWFEPFDPKKIGGGCDRLIVYGCLSEEKRIGRVPCKAVLRETLITDLTATAEELWKQPTKTIRNEINRAKRENVHVTIYTGGEITDELLLGFNGMFHEKFEEKGITERTLPLKELREYASKDALVITSALIDDIPVVYHSYIVDDTHSRLMHSCSQFRTVDNAQRNAIGRANKYLHWCDWLYLKEKGVKEYDWGCIGSYECPSSIDQFKLSFGGSYKEYYQLSCDYSFAARLYAKLQKGMQLLKQ